MIREREVWFCPLCRGPSDEDEESCPWCGAPFRKGQKLPAPKRKESIIITSVPEPELPPRGHLTFHDLDVDYIDLSTYNKMMIAMLSYFMVLVMAPPLIFSYLELSVEMRGFWTVMIWMLGALFLLWVYHEYQLRQRQKLLDSEPRWEILEVHSE